MNDLPNHIELIPASAPFSPEQRSWLNGFFAGYLSIERETAAHKSSSVESNISSSMKDLDEEELPWHDQTLALDARMALAEGRPLRQRLMAAMAQQDCGQCGYICETYAEALAGGNEERTGLCAPGGKETARTLKGLLAEIGANGFTTTFQQSISDPKDSPLGYSRDNPVFVSFHTRNRLSKDGSEKDTWHIEFDLSESGVIYQPGDSFGVFVRNDPFLVDEIIMVLGVSDLTPVGKKTFREALISDLSLSPAPDSLFELISFISGGDARKKAQSLARGEDPDRDASTLDVLSALRKFPNAKPHPEAVLEALEPLQPRLYSISSSPLACPGHLSLTVEAVRYTIEGRTRLGVASTYLTERIKNGEKIYAYVQSGHGFRLPGDDSIPIIMVGPGTGVAPFRSFLQHREAVSANGRSWLFFGHQRSDYDFLYSDYFESLLESGALTKLSLAWSRDGKEKIYVQDRIRESGSELWTWIDEGAHIYVCGDAKRMAKDVERAFVSIISEFGRRTESAAFEFLAVLKKSGRYQQDIY